MKTFSEELRYEYPELTKDSVVFDCGAYQGSFTREIYRRYRPRIVMFEPIGHYASELQYAFLEFYEKEYSDGGQRDVKNAAVGANNGVAMMNVRNDSTGLFGERSEPRELVQVVSINEMVDRYGPVIHLMKLNIEGMEYDVIEALIESGKINQVKNLQVQFHDVVQNAKQKHERLRNELLKTHEPEWDSEPVWQNFRLK